MASPEGENFEKLLQESQIENEYLKEMFKKIKFENQRIQGFALRGDLPSCIGTLAHVPKKLDMTVDTQHKGDDMILKSKRSF